MKIRLLGWESEGLRCPDVKIDLGSVHSPPKVALIQMPNGTGKTTTLTLIRAALTGDAANWDAESVLQLKQRDDKTKTSGKFILRLAVDNKDLIFDLHFDFINGVISYRTSSPSAGGVVPGWEPPNEVRRFLSPKFTNLFVFDGEYAFKLLKPQEPLADEAIDALCQLDLLDRVRATAEGAWDRETRNKGAKTSQGLAIYKNKEKFLEERIHTITENRKKGILEIAKIDERLEEIKRKIGDKINAAEKFSHELSELKEEESTYKNIMERLTDQAMRTIRQPHMLHKGFAEGLMTLKSRLDRAKLPDMTSRQFFVDLADGKNCICGRPIGTVEKDHILSQSNHYLGEEVSGTLNALKQDIASLVASNDKNQPSLEEVMLELRNTEASYHSIQTELQILTLRAQEDSRDEVQSLMDLHKTLTSKKDHFNDMIEEIDRDGTEDDKGESVSLLHLKKQLDAVRDEISQITDTVELREKTDIIKKLTSLAKDLSRKRLKSVLIKACNDRLAHILSANPLQIKDISNSLVLSDQQEASVGETLAVGYTFLTAALHRGAHQFPLIVDSPAGALDDKVRQEIGEMVPQLCEQFVAFTISTERDNFLPALERKSGGQVKYFTIFRKSAGTQHLLQSIPADIMVLTNNAVIVEGRDYFTQFSLVKESEE